jgi:hypothetical protein
MKQLTIFKSHYNGMESLVHKFSRDLLEKHRSPRIDHWGRLSLIFRKNQEYIVPDQISIQHLNHLFVQLSFYVNSLQNKNASTASELFEVTQVVRLFQNELRMLVHDRSNKEAATSSLTQYVRETKNSELHDHAHSNEYLERTNTILQNVLLRPYFLTNPSALFTVNQLADVFQKKKSGSKFANAHNQLFTKHSAHPLTETLLVRFFRFGRELSYERSLSYASNLLTELTKKSTSVDNRIITAQAVQRFTESPLLRLFQYGLANYDTMSNRKLAYELLFKNKIYSRIAEFLQHHSHFERNHILTNEDKLITLQKLEHKISSSQTKQTNSLDSTQLFVEKQMAGILQNELGMDFKYRFPLMNPVFSQGTNIDHVVKETIRRVNSTLVGLPDQQQHISLPKRRFTELTEPFSFSQTKQTNSLNSTQLFVEKQIAGILQNEIQRDFKYRLPLMNPGFSFSSNIHPVVKEIIRRVKSTPVSLPDQQQHISLAKHLFTEQTEQISSSQMKQTNIFLHKQQINGFVHDLKNKHLFSLNFAKKIIHLKHLTYEQVKFEKNTHHFQKLVNKYLTTLTNRFANVRMMSKPNKRSHLIEESESVSYQTRNILNEMITRMPQISPHTKTYKLPVEENILGSRSLHNNSMRTENHIISNNIVHTQNMTRVNHLNRDIHRRASVIHQTTTDLSKKLKDKNKPAIIDQNMEPKFEPQTLHYVKLTKQPEREMLSSSQQDVTMQYAKPKTVQHDNADQKTDKTLANTQTETKIAASQTIYEQIQSTDIDKIVDKVFREFERKLRMESTRRGY